MIPNKHKNQSISILDTFRIPSNEIMAYFSDSSHFSQSQSSLMTLNEYTVLFLMLILMVVGSYYMFMLLFLTNSGGARVLGKPYLRGDAI